MAHQARVGILQEQRLDVLLEQGQTLSKVQILQDRGRIHNAHMPLPRPWLYKHVPHVCEGADNIAHPHTRRALHSNNNQTVPHVSRGGKDG
jgi:hypothetical protein